MKRRSRKVRRIVLGTGWTWNAEHFAAGGPYAKLHEYGTEYRVFLVKGPTEMQGRFVRLVLEVLPGRPPEKKAGVTR